MRDETLAVLRSKVSLEGFDSLSVPVYRASTIRYPDAASFADRFNRDADGYVYGLYGTPSHRYLEKKITELEGGSRTVLAPSGQAAIASTMLALLRTGDHILVPDTAYGPVRDFAAHELSALGIIAEFYAPTDIAVLEMLIRPETRMIWCESPGSLTMELQDVPAIVRLAHARDILVACDNTWASPLNFKPIQHGVDIVIEALSKHFGGHSDILMGSVTTADDALGLQIKAAFRRMGVGTSPDDCVLVLRGIETLPVRIERCGNSGLQIAAWLSLQPQVERVLHPGLPEDPGHALWQRDFRGACGVFSFTLKSEWSSDAFAALDALEIFAIGASWGGTKSLIAPSAVKNLRTARPWTGPDYLFRLNVGLESPDDLLADLGRFLGELKAKPSSMRQ